MDQGWKKPEGLIINKEDEEDGEEEQKEVDSDEMMYSLPQKVIPVTSLLMRTPLPKFRTILQKSDSHSSNGTCTVA